VDLTDLPVFWHRDTFHAENLNNNGTGNHAMWSGVAADDPYGASWNNVPGYGNNWNDVIIYESDPLANPDAGQIVGLNFWFNHDTEPGFDFFEVQYDSAGTWTTVMSVDGSNKDASNVFQAPGVQFSAQQTADIVYNGLNGTSLQNDYGANEGIIRIRMVVSSDGAWSDQDGLWPTDGGAAQVDDITLTTSEGSFAETFETELFPPDRYLFDRDKAPFAGDFAFVYGPPTTSFFADIDPCRDNLTPVIGMLDFNQEIRNGPGLGGDISTGGSTAEAQYGLEGFPVVNYNGGLSFGEVNVTNEIWSPDISWAVAAPGSSAPEVSGAFIRFDVWRDLPLIDGVFYVWGVRSALTGESYGSWADRNFVYYGTAPALWFAGLTQDVSDLLQAGPEASLFGFPGNRAQPSPVFDNVSFYKYRLAGPTFATRTIDIANDGFPTSGSIDVSSPTARGALDIPFDMARDVNTGDVFNVAGDSIIVDVASTIPGASTIDIRMVWSLRVNNLFETAVRGTTWRAKDENLSTPPTGAVPGFVTWTGEVVHDTSTTSAGAIVDNRFFFDLPDENLMYPGDILHYYVQAIDSDGRTTTWPANLDGFGDYSPDTAWSRTRTVRCLPTITDATGSQPDILVWNDFGRRGEENDWVTALLNLGYGEHVDYDSYTTQGPTSGISNGLGSAGVHGANADQLAGYNHMIYLAGNLTTFLMSDGTNVGNNDKANDIDVMEQWHALAGVRNAAYFADGIATGMAQDSPAGLTYLGSPMGVAYGDSDVRDVIGGQTAPLVVPNSTGPYAGDFGTSFIAYGGCIGINEFDQIQPASGADAGHLWTDAAGAAIPENPDPALGGVASVINPTANGLDITIPIGVVNIYNVQAREVGLSARAELLREILILFNTGPGTSPVVSAPKAAKPQLSIHPNPFNPSTEVFFSNTFGKKGSVKVFNLRGELVKTLHNGEFTNADGFSKVWDGTDNRGASVASGVYVIQAQADGQVDTKKAALVK
jgi:hypothetical protein